MKDDLEQNLYWILVRAAVAPKQALARAGEQLGFSRMQLFVLCLIDEKGKMPMQTITTLLGCEASNVTGLVDKLVKSGFIERSENTNDRRIKLVTLTPEGKRVRALAMKELKSANLSLLSNLTESERIQFGDLIMKMICPPQPEAKK